MIRLLLNLPDQHDLDDPSVERDPRRLRKALSELPVLNLEESLRRVLDTLEPLNEQKLEFRQRLRLMDVYLPTAQRLYDTAEPLRLRQSPLTRRQRVEIVDAVERLCRGMADGFKRIVLEWHRAGVERRDQPRFAQVLRRTVRQLGCQLVHSYRFYRPLPPFLFLELNQLYRLARHLGLHEAAPATEGVPHLAAHFQALSLLAACDPFHLAEGQVDAWYPVLLKYVPDCRLVPGNSWKGTPEGLFYLDLLGDSVPRPCVFLQPPVAGEDPHLLDARKALQAMHTALAALPADRRPRRAEAGILKSLLPEVRGEAGEQRREPRRPDGRWMRILGGLEAIHAWLGQPSPDRSAVSAWQVRDASDQGYRLACGDDVTAVLGAGELLCVLADSADDQARPHLALVRWVRNGRDGGSEIGVERLAGVPAPVRLQPDDEPGSDYPALFLSAPGQPARLVAPAGLYRPGRALTILAGERAVAARCADSVLDSPLLDCFEFTSG